MTPTLGGGLLLAGGNGPSWVVGELSASGRLDLGFGHEGWATLTPPDVPHYSAKSVTAPATPWASSVVQAPTGTIYVGGNNGGPHCCVQAIVAALSPSGHLEDGFGSHGWASVFPQGSFDARPFVQPDGRIDVIGDIVFGGCGGPVLSVLSRGGRVEPRLGAMFAKTLDKGFSSYE